MTKTKSGRELEGESVHMSPPIVRRFLAFFGIGPGVDDEE